MSAVSTWVNSPCPVLPWLIIYTRSSTITACASKYFSPKMMRICRPCSSCGSRRTGWNARSTTCSASGSTIIRTCAGFSCRRITTDILYVRTFRLRATDMQAREIIVPTSSVAMLRKPDPLGDTEMTVSLGPQHPSTHGVLRLELVLDGETVVKATPDIGYLHTGIEKTMEKEKWQQVVTVTCRADYLNSMGNDLGYCLAVEKLMGVRSEERRVGKEGRQRRGQN